MEKHQGPKGTESKKNESFNPSLQFVCRKAYEAIRSSHEGDIPLELNGTFTVYLLGVENKQTFRYLRKIIRTVLGETEFRSYAELKREFSTSAVSRRIAELPLEEAGSVFQLWGNAARELEDAFGLFREEMGNAGVRVSDAASSGRADPGGSSAPEGKPAAAPSEGAATSTSPAEENKGTSPLPGARRNGQSGGRKVRGVKG